MTEVTITIKNLDRVLQAFREGDRAMGRDLERGLRQATEYGRSFLASYPPPPARSTYRRTGTLGRRWTTRLETGPRLRGLIGNVTPYAPDVQDRDRQAAVHQGRWQTMQDLTEQPHAGKIRDIVQDAVNRWATRMNK